MKINLRIDSTALVLRLQNGQRRLAYAVVNAINNTAKRIQEAERRRVEEEFTVRKAQFMRREAAKPFASVRQGRAYAEMSPPAGNVPHAKQPGPGLAQEPIDHMAVVVRISGIIDHRFGPK